MVYINCGAVNHNPHPMYTESAYGPTHLLDGQRSPSSVLNIQRRSQSTPTLILKECSLFTLLNDIESGVHQLWRWIIVLLLILKSQPCVAPRKQLSAYLIYSTTFRVLRY
jgi:hypothetical protein